MMTTKLLFISFVGLFFYAEGLGETRKISFNIREYDESFGEFLREILENFREHMNSGIPEIGIPPVDPLKIPDIDRSINDGKANMVLRMSNLTIVHLSTFILKNLTADLEKGFAHISVSVPKLKATGFCYMNGKILNIFPISSDGDFHLEVQDAEIEGIAHLNITTGKNVTLHMNDIKLSLSFGPLEIEFASLLGGGRWTQVLLKLVTGIGRNLFMQFHERAMRVLDKVLLKLINKELDKGTLTEILNKIPLPSAHIDTKYRRKYDYVINEN